MPSYWWAGPGYGDYSDGLAGFISPDRYIDITAFGTFFPGETQYALNRYNEMVTQNFNAAQEAASLETTRQLIQDLLNDSDPNNDAEAVQLLASNPNLGVQLNGQSYYGMDAAGVVAARSGVINVGQIATVTVYANGSSNVTYDFQPFARYDDGYGNTSNVLWDPSQGQYIFFDNNNQADRQRAAVAYSQQAQAERQAGHTQAADYLERLARFFQVTPTERVGLSRDMRIDRNLGNAMSAPTPNEQALTELMQRRAFTIALWNGATIDNPNTWGTASLAVYQEYRTSRPGDWMLNRPGNAFDLGANGIQSGAAMAGFISLWNTTLNTIAIGNRANQLQQWNNQIEALRQQVIAESTYLVPPRPNEIDNYMFGLRSVLSPEDYNRMYAEISNLSAAFWGGNP